MSLDPEFQTYDTTLTEPAPAGFYQRRAAQQQTQLLSPDVESSIRATAKIIGHEDLLRRLASYAYVSGQLKGIADALAIDANKAVR